MPQAKEMPFESLHFGTKHKLKWNVQRKYPLQAYNINRRREGRRNHLLLSLSCSFFFLFLSLSLFATLGFFAIPTQILQPQRALNGDACNINNAGQQKQQQTGKGMKTPEKNTVTHKAHIDTLNTLLNGKQIKLWFAELSPNLCQLCCSSHKKYSYISILRYNDLSMH